MHRPGTLWGTEGFFVGSNGSRDSICYGLTEAPHQELAGEFDAHNCPTNGVSRTLGAHVSEPCRIKIPG